MFGKTKWYRTAHRAYRKKKMDEPYRTLFRYYMEVGWGTPIAHTGSHREFFVFEKWDGILEESTEHLRRILPQHLFENYRSALAAFESLGEDPEYEEVKTAFEIPDEYVIYHNEELMQILIDYVTEMKAKKIF